KLLQTIHGFNPTYFKSPFFSEFFSLPNSNMRVGFTQTKYFSVFFFFRIRKEQRYTFLLVNTAQIKYIPMLLKRHGTVGTYRINIIRVKHRNAFGLHLSHKVFTVFDKKGVVDLSVFHSVIPAFATIIF